MKATKLLNFLINDNKDIPVDALSAAKSYAVLRAALCTFTKITPSSNFKISTINLLALAIANGLKGPAGEDLLELYRPTVESETFRKNRKLILQTAHKYTQFDWNKELPERLTRFVNVHPDGREELITLPVPLPADPGPDLSQYGRKKEPMVPLPAPPTMVPQ